jgi:hypothetical protein
MHILDKGRKEYLDFLRNLTPQAILLAVAVIAKMQTSWSCCDTENIGITVTATIFFLMFAASVYANTSIFLESFIKSKSNLGAYSKALKENGYSRLKYTYKIFIFTFRHEFYVFLEALVILTFYVFSLTLVILFAISSADSLLRAMHHTKIN